MFTWDDDLRIGQTRLYLDGHLPRGACFVSHAHSDHVAAHGQIWCTPATDAIGRWRFPEWPPAHQMEYGTPIAFDPELTLTARPAGHVLGSAMLLATRSDGATALYTGDFKLGAGLTCPPAEPPAADVLLTECTYGRPEYRFPDPAVVREQLCDLVAGALRAGRQPVVMGYSLGKAQEATRALTDAGFAVTQHGAVYNLTAVYERLGASCGPVRRYAFADFHGPAALDLRQRGVLVAPPRVARTGFVTRFNNPLRIVLTGWALDPSAKYRYGVDHALPLSDHADFDELLALVTRVRPRKVFTHHGYAAEFAEHLRGMGIDAAPIRPPEQMELFG